MIGLALSGGGVKGSYQIGAYYALKKCHIRPNMVTGTSIGSFNGALIAAHKEKELLKFWQSADIGKILGIDNEYEKLIYSPKKDLSFYKQTIESLKKLLKQKGISISGMQEILNNFNIENKLRKSRIKFGLSTLRLNDLKMLNLTLDEIPEGKLNDFIMASCYLPIFQKEKLNGNEYFADGGFVNYIPIDMLIENGCNKIYAVDLKAPGYKRKVSKNADITYIKPSRKLTSMLSLDEEKIINNMKIGYYDTLKILKHYDGYKFIFKRKSEKYYDHLISKVDDKILNKMILYFNSENSKVIILKALEFVMKDYSYFNIYNPKKVIKYIKKSNNKGDVYKFIQYL